MDILDCFEDCCCLRACNNAGCKEADIAKEGGREDGRNLIVELLSLVGSCALSVCWVEDPGGRRSSIGGQDRMSQFVAAAHFDTSESESN